MVNYVISKTCCFLGHRKVKITEELKTKLKKEIENLIVFKKVDVFLFGSRSQFEDLCYDIVTDLKQKYDIKRVYVRAEYKNISKEYKDGLLTAYEDTYFPINLKSGVSVYIKRNEEMINKSKFCLFYYNEKYVPTTGYGAVYTNKNQNSGTYLSYHYAVKNKKHIINFYTDDNILKPLI